MLQLHHAMIALDIVALIQVSQKYIFKHLSTYQKEKYTMGAPINPVFCPW